MVDRPTWKAFFLFFCSLDLTCTADWGGGGWLGMAQHSWIGCWLLQLSLCSAPTLQFLSKNRQERRKMI